MLQLVRIFAIIVVIKAVIDNNGSTVRSELLPFCGYSSNTSTCGDDSIKVRYPFWIENRTVDETGRNCTSYPGFQITCAAKGWPVINISSNLYYVMDIYKGLLTIVDVDTYTQECPHPPRNISIDRERFLSYKNDTVNMIFFYNCSKYPEKVVQHIPCLDKLYNTSTRRSFAFLEVELSSNQFDWYANCQEAVVMPVDNSYSIITSFYDGDFTLAVSRGFQVDFQYPANCVNCELSGGKCLTNKTSLPPLTTVPLFCNCPYLGTPGEGEICRGEYFNSYVNGRPEYNYRYEDHKGISKRSILIIGVSVGIGGVVLLILLFIYGEKCYSLYNSTASSCRKIARNCYLLYNFTASNCWKIIKGPTDAEVFIWNNFEGLSLQNYTYSDIKRMTNFFEDSLGQGGFGSVFKGKLRDGRSVAVKVLNESKGKGEDFINEVGTIGRTNHVNVVSLLGFCIDGTKQALVYEFMPNGSLEKFIHNAKDSSNTSSFLGWEKLYQIALGIARGLDYLHRGCNTRILHFDIKPHNILLDEDFCPKISDFGLAKICTTRESFVSMVGARGTPGYIAPEVYCGNFGGVSYKSDVYSFGMMVLEMIGGRKNMDILAENVSQIYFPQWIYKRLTEKTEVEESEDIEANVVLKEIFKEETARKMIIVALWCIQAHPGDRPSITKVVELLEGNTEDLQFPPNPFPDPSLRSSLS